MFVEGGIYHVHNRFASGEPVFADPEEGLVSQDQGEPLARRPAPASRRPYAVVPRFASALHIYLFRLWTYH